MTDAEKIVAELCDMIAARLSRETTRKLALLDEIMAAWESGDCYADSLDAVGGVLASNTARVKVVDAERSE